MDERPYHREFLSVAAFSALRLPSSSDHQLTIPEDVAAEVAADYVDPARSNLVGQSGDSLQAIRQLESAVIHLRGARSPLSSKNAPPNRTEADGRSCVSLPPALEREVQTLYRRYRAWNGGDNVGSFEEFVSEHVDISAGPDRSLSITLEG